MYEIIIQRGSKVSCYGAFGTLEAATKFAEDEIIKGMNGRWYSNINGTDASWFRSNIGYRGHMSIAVQEIRVFLECCPVEGICGICS